VLHVRPSPVPTSSKHEIGSLELRANAGVVHMTGLECLHRTVLLDNLNATAPAWLWQSEELTRTSATPTGIQIHVRYFISKQYNNTQNLAETFP
jgi:hypothetical protein